MWEVKEIAFCGKKVVLDEDRDWEPFAAYPNPVAKDMTYLVLRRQVPEKKSLDEQVTEAFAHRTSPEKIYNRADMDCAIDRVRTETLKEVGKWLLDTGKWRSGSDEHSVRYEDLDNFLKGRMP